MAKTTNCVFCGKEMTTGFFKGDSSWISLGDEIVDCCEDCRAKYAQNAKRVEKRFGVKLENYKKATKKKPTPSALVNFFLRYLDEEAEQLARCGEITTKEDAGYFALDTDKQYFAVREFPLGTDTTSGQMSKSITKAEDVGKVWFSKEDITKLEYRTTFIGNSTGLFSTAYSFEVRFNDEKEMTYKPCIARMTFVGTGLFPHTQKKKAKQMCAGALTLLKVRIGSDIPVTEVKRFV